MSYLIPPEIFLYLPAVEHLEEVRVKRGYKPKAIGMWNKSTLMSEAHACGIPESWVESHRCTFCNVQLIHLNHPQRVIPVGFLETYEMTPGDLNDIYLSLYSLQAQFTAMNYLVSPSDSFKSGDEHDGDKFFFLTKTEKVCYSCVLKHFDQLISILRVQIYEELAGKLNELG